MNLSKARFDNWSKECEEELNRHIVLEFEASYQYLALFTYFDRDSVALENIAKYFKKSSEEETEHATELIKYQNKRGGVINFFNLSAPITEFDSSELKSNILLAFEKALEMEQSVFSSLKRLHKVGDDAGDAQFCDYLESHFLEEQINANNEIAKYITKLEMIGLDGHGLYQFNQNF